MMEYTYINISGFGINQPNRGNAALNFGTLSFLKEKGYIEDNTRLVAYRFRRNPFKAFLQKPIVYNFIYDNHQWHYTLYPVFALERWLLRKLKIVLPWTHFGRTLKKTKLAVADFGGDGFSDIYGQKILDSRFTQYEVISKMGVPLIILPQTIGPFKNPENYNYAVGVLRYAKEIYVRDDKFENDLKRLGLKYEKTKDLSAYMLPEKWDVDVKENAVGLNVSGLAYSNKFVNLEGQFDAYPLLIERIIGYFQKKGLHIYLIPHSYNFQNPEINNDDMVACKQAFDNLKDKTNVHFVEKNLSAPQVKYVISKMSFFIGTRMHANFAAIYTGVPLFGLAYSYKFIGAFNANGLNGELQTYTINYLKKEDIDYVLNRIEYYYNTVISQ